MNLWFSSASGSSSFSQSEKTKVFYIAVGVACSVILVIALAVAAIHVHSLPSQNTSKDGPRLESWLFPKPDKTFQNCTSLTTLIPWPTISRNYYNNYCCVLEISISRFKMARDWYIGIRQALKNRAISEMKKNWTPVHNDYSRESRLKYVATYIEHWVLQEDCFQLNK